jgi:hypothetical protein
VSHSVAPPLELGTELAGFRLERVIGHGSQGIVYEATQVSLDRRVALKLLPADRDFADRLQRLRWPEHPHAVSMFAAGVCEHGEFVAMQLVGGPTLAELRDAGLEPAEVLDVLGDVAEALDAAHRAGIVHGAISAQNVLVDGDGRVLLSDFGLGPGEATPASDRTAFAALVRECLGDDLPALGDPSSALEVVRFAAAALPPTAVQDRGRLRWRRLVAAAIGGSGAVAVLAVVLAAPGKEPERAPPILRGTQPLGSALPPAATNSVDCRGRSPSGASPGCTVLQTRLLGRNVVARRGGVISRWAVRGARGKIALQVLHRRGDEFASVARSEYELIPDEGVHAVAANLPIRAGDRVGMEVTPGAAIGVRSSTGETTSARWFGPLTWRSRPVESGAGSGLDDELLLRVEYAPGAQWRPPGGLTGHQAELARAGRELATREVDLSGGAVRRVAVLRVGDRIAVDLFAGERRLARLVVEGAKVSGRLLSLTAHGVPIASVQWRNPDGRTITRDYAVRTRSVVPLN